MRLLLVDNYDSFTYILADYLKLLGAKITVVYNDCLHPSDLSASSFDGIIISPGPCSPTESGFSIGFVEKFCSILPILGICLGHQCIAHYLGCKIIRLAVPKHGKISALQCSPSLLFSGLPQSFEVTRYHSLVVDKETVGDKIKVTAYSSDDNSVMAIEDTSCNLYGVQFHPESIASQYGKQILMNFIGLLNR